MDGAPALRGELAALAAAFLWAVGSVIWSLVGRRIVPLELNLIKIAIAMVLLVPTLWLGGVGLAVDRPEAVVLLLASGVVGIGLADTFFLEALKQLGARRALMLRTLDPPFAALLALFFLGEALGFWAWGGVVLTVLGVAWVIGERTATRLPVTEPSAVVFRRWGVICGVLGALGQAAGAVLARQALVETEITPAWSTLLRLGGGLAVVLVWVGLKRQPLGRWLEQPPVEDGWSLGQLLGAISFAAFTATFLGIWLQQTALKFTAAGIAQTLCATSPLFVLPFAAWMGEKIGYRAILGVLVSLGGVALLIGQR
ncbi:DMT family transporter [Gloeobacter violaceus]|uniref:Gll3359 protein n=1 Tax=Gloeobacter violaceus (strain ATCC 29082 / PCC 7421) TaxID=251221 RepID=Q7NG15_GLOVI|nr:DMT family transporter [Gloeobacter violaceus]BAC91300.1 gll3359 [Gloeobacter violaceus PCC 7421]